MVDVERINRDPWKETEEQKVSLWRERFSKVGKEIDRGVSISGGKREAATNGVVADGNGVRVCPNCGE